MARSNVTWRLKGQWPVIMERAAAFAPDIPEEGITRAQFEYVVLMDVDPRDIDEVLAALHRRKVVYVSRNRGAVTVYGKRPPTRHKPDWMLSPSASPMGKLVAAIAPHVLAVLEASDSDFQNLACGRIVGFCDKCEADGLPLSDIRAALWRLFPAEVMNRTARLEPRLQKGNTALQFERRVPTPKRIARGLSLAEKLLAMVEKAGREGITLTTALKGLPPDERKLDIAGILAGHEEAGRIVSGVMRSAERGRPGKRYFTAEHGLPQVDRYGLMRFSL